MNKKIIFFDGDGTLWYPKNTKRSKRPDWIYSKNTKSKKYLPLLTLTPSIAKVLLTLKRKGKILIALSTHPHSLKEADEHMNSKIKHLKIEHLFDSILTARPHPLGKGNAILNFLKKSKIPKSQALLIGDSYLYDYRSAKSVGVDCLLIKTPYMSPKGRRVKKTITNLSVLSKL